MDKEKQLAYFSCEQHHHKKTIITTMNLNKFILFFTLKTKGTGKQCCCGAPWSGQVESRVNVTLNLSGGHQFLQDLRALGNILRGENKHVTQGG